MLQLLLPQLRQRSARMNVTILQPLAFSRSFAPVWHILLGEQRNRARVAAAAHIDEGIPAELFIR